MHTRLGLSFLLVLGFLATSAQAVIISGFGDGTPTPMVVPPSDFGGALGWEVGTSSAPVEVTLDPGAGPIAKMFERPPGELGTPWADDHIGETGDVGHQTFFPVDEWFIIGEGPEWTDWHEEVGTPGWKWSFASILVKKPGDSDFSIPDGLFTGPMSGPSPVVEFFFDPLPVGTEVYLSKELVYVGLDGLLTTDDDPTHDIFDGDRIDIAEYPTPEPTTLVLSTLTSISLLLRRRRT